MLTEAIAAARTGDRSRARELLARLLNSDSANAEYWVWMSSVVDTRRERIYCLESALNVDPTNRAALRGLVVLGARKPEEKRRQKSKLPRRKVSPSARSRPGRRLQFSWGMLGGALLGIVALTLLGSVVLSMRGMGGGAVRAPTLPPATGTATLTPEIPTATMTPIPAETRTFRTPIPTELAATPITAFIEQTPTPTPVLGLTPRPSYEAYGAGIAALQRGDFEDAAEFMEQVIDIDDTLADAYYFLGEARRLNDQPGTAVLAYDRATLIDPDYAPAFLGRGRARLDLTLRQNGELRPSDLPNDFDQALEIDPQLMEAYLAKAEFQASQRQWRTMEDTLQAALDAGVTDPLIYIRLSQAQYNRARFEESLESAVEGSAGDPSNLEGYLAIGRAHAALDQFDQSLWPLQTYVAYRPEDHTGWSHLSRALLGQERLEEALDAANRSLELDDRYAPGYISRALARLEIGQDEAALEDMQQARRYGPENYNLFYGFASTYYHLGRYVDAVRTINDAIAIAETPSRKADSYALRALIYEATNPPLLDEAILNWQWIVDTEGASEDTVELAEIHLAALQGEGPTLTPTLEPPAETTPDVTPTATSTP